MAHDPAHLENGRTGTDPSQMYGWSSSGPVRLLASSYGTLLNGLSIPPHDGIEFTWTDGNVTGIVFKSSTITVATLTLTYSSGLISSIVKS